MNYYNENDPKAAAWLRELIKQGHIPAGDVDERSIVEVKPYELTRYTQQHFFAGIGGWPLALRIAGWPDDKSVRTGSCPCQPFSQTGKRLGTKDERHLWPHFRDLITFGESTITFGEQVASPLGREWLAGVRDDLEGMGYEVGAADLCAAGVAAPHIRQRLYWVAHTNQRRRNSRGGTQSKGSELQSGNGQLEQRSGAGRMELSESNGREQRRAESVGRGVESRCGVGRLADTKHGDWRREQQSREPGENRRAGSSGSGEADGMVQSDGSGRDSRKSSVEAAGHRSSVEPAGSADKVGDTDSSGSQGRNERIFKCDYQWPPGTPNLVVLCEDGKARRFEPGSFPLAHGVSHRVGLLRGYGNGICPQIAAEFIHAAIESLDMIRTQA